MSVGHTVLVIEDDEALRGMLVEVLRDEGYQVLEAADGERALDLLRADELPTDLCLVLLDLMLPKCSGLEVLGAMGAIRDVIPVVAVSASPQHLPEAVRAGARETVSKPFDLDGLLSVVNRYCELHQPCPPDAMRATGYSQQALHRVHVAAAPLFRRGKPCGHV
jgi:DNA-binding response OmpR family regulator